MRMMSRRCGIAALACTALAGSARAWDLGEWLEIESKKDQAVVGPTTCWCKDINVLVDSRIDAASSELQGLESAAKIQHFENEQLSLKVKDHNADAGEHQQTLDQAVAINSRFGAGSDGHVGSLEQALGTIRSAIDNAESGSSAHSTLKELEGMMAKKLESFKAEDEAASFQFKELQAAKQKMLRLSKEAAASHERRLADGMAAVAQANAQIDAYTARREADHTLSSSVKSLCERLESEAEERAKLRQDSTILVSQAKVEQAQHKSQEAASKLMSLTQSQFVRGVRAHGQNTLSTVTSRLLAALELRHDRHGSCPTSVEHAEFSERLAAEALDGSKKSAHDLMALVAKASDVKTGLGRMLQGAVTNAHVAENKLKGDLKAFVDKIFSMAQGQLSSLTQPFDDIQANGKESAMADQRLVTELMSAKADASQELVEAKRCNR